MYSRAKILSVSVFVVLCYLALQGQNVMAEEVLKNQDIVKMISGGLSEDIIVAKIREAAQVDFQLSIDDLVALHKAGVSDRVVGAMLARGKPRPKDPANAFGTMPGSNANVSLKTTDGTFPLRLVTGKVSSAGWNIFMNYPVSEPQYAPTTNAQLCLSLVPPPWKSANIFLQALIPIRDVTLAPLNLGKRSGEAERQEALCPQMQIGYFHSTFRRRVQELGVSCQKAPLSLESTLGMSICPTQMILILP